MCLLMVPYSPSNSAAVVKSVWITVRLIGVLGYCLGRQLEYSQHVPPDVLEFLAQVAADRMSLASTTKRTVGFRVVPPSSELLAQKDTRLLQPLLISWDVLVAKGGF